MAAASERTDHVLAAIDGALADWDVSSDAMRWTGEAPEELPEPAALNSRARVRVSDQEYEGIISYTPAPEASYGFAPGEPIGVLRELGITPAVAVPQVWDTGLGAQVLAGIPVRVDPGLPEGWLRLVSDTDSVTWRVTVRETAAASPIEDILAAVRALGFADPTEHHDA